MSTIFFHYYVRFFPVNNRYCFSFVFKNRVPDCEGFSRQMNAFNDNFHTNSKLNMTV